MLKYLEEQRTIKLINRIAKKNVQKNWITGIILPVHHKKGVVKEEEHKCAYQANMLARIKKNRIRIKDEFGNFIEKTQYGFREG